MDTSFPPLKWWHITLHVDDTGLATITTLTETPFELRLNLHTHTLEFLPDDGSAQNLSLRRRIVAHRRLDGWTAAVSHRQRIAATGGIAA